MNVSGAAALGAHDGLGDPMQDFFMNAESPCYTQIRDHINHVIRLISPVRLAEDRRRAVCAFVKAQVEAVVQNPVAVVGSFASKVYLPDSDIDLTAFVHPRQGTNWVNELVSALVKRGIEDNSRDDAPYQIRNVTFVNAETKLVKCVINNIQVDITDNKFNNVLACSFLLALNKAVGKDDLLSRSILLIKAWCSYDAVGFVQEPLLGSDKSRLTSFGLTTMVLFIFNRFEISHPLVALAHFFTYFKGFNWKRNVLTVYGPVAARADGAGISLASAVRACKFTPLLPQNIFQRFHKIFKECRPSSLVPGGDTSSQRFPSRHVNILDPLDDSNNIGKSVNKTGVIEMALAFSSGEKYLKTILGCLAYAAHFDATTAPWEDGQSPVLQARTFSQQLFHSSLNKFGRGDGYRPDLLMHPCETWVWRPPAARKAASTHSKTPRESKGAYAAAVISGAPTDGTSKNTQKTVNNYAIYKPSQADAKALKKSLEESRQAFARIFADAAAQTTRSRASVPPNLDDSATTNAATPSSRDTSQVGSPSDRRRKGSISKGKDDKEGQGGDSSTSSASHAKSSSSQHQRKVGSPSRPRLSRNSEDQSVDEEEQAALLAAANRIRSPKEIQRSLDHLGTNPTSSLPSPQDPQAIQVDAVLSRLSSMPSPRGLAADSIRNNIFKTASKSSHQAEDDDSSSSDGDVESPPASASNNRHKSSKVASSSGGKSKDGAGTDGGAKTKQLKGPPQTTSNSAAAKQKGTSGSTTRRKSKAGQEGKQSSNSSARGRKGSKGGVKNRTKKQQRSSTAEQGKRDTKRVNKKQDLKVTNAIRPAVCGCSSRITALAAAESPLAVAVGVVVLSIVVGCIVVAVLVWSPQTVSNAVSSSLPSVACSGHGDEMWLEHKQWILAENTIAASREQKQKTRQTRGKTPKVSKALLKNYPTADEDNIHEEVLEFVDLHDPTDPAHLAALGHPSAKYCVCHRGWTGPKCERTFLAVGEATLSNLSAANTTTTQGVAMLQDQNCEREGGCTFGASSPPWPSFHTTTGVSGQAHASTAAKFWVQADFEQYRHRGASVLSSSSTRHGLRQHDPTGSYSTSTERAMNPHLLHHHMPPAQKRTQASPESAPKAIDKSTNYQGRRVGQMGRGANLGGASGGYASNSFSGSSRSHPRRVGTNRMPDGAVTE